MISAPIDDAQALGLVLRDARMDRGLTQRDIADRLGVAVSYVASLEAGKSTKAIARIFEFANATGLVLSSTASRD